LCRHSGYVPITAKTLGTSDSIQNTIRVECERVALHTWFVVYPRVAVSLGWLTTFFENLIFTGAASLTILDNVGTTFHRICVGCNGCHQESDEG
jgi:hypothetical protein